MSGVTVSMAAKKFAMKDLRPVVEALLLVHTKAASLALGLERESFANRDKKKKVRRTNKNWFISYWKSKTNLKSKRIENIQCFGNFIWVFLLGYVLEGIQRTGKSKSEVGLRLERKTNKET